MGDKEGEDFVSLWKKKAAAGEPSAVGGLIEKISQKTAEVAELTKQNEELKEKIVKNIDLLNEAEKVIKGLKEKVSAFDIEKKNATMKLQMENDVLKRELEKNKAALLETQQVIKQRDEEIYDLKTAITAPVAIKVGDLEELEEKIKQKDNQIEEIAAINKELMEKIKSQESEIVAFKKAEDELQTHGSINLLVQDLQDKLNQSKKKVQSLIAENKQLKSAQPKAAGGGDHEKIVQLEQEKQDLLNKINEFESSKKSAETELIKSYEEKLTNKDTIIKDLESQLTSAPQTSSGGAVPTGLLEDLQNKINKLKVEIKKKDKIIADLKKQEK